VLYHAEIIAINEALKKINTRYLSDCELYVTLEPCAMCTGAIIHSGIKRVYIGATDEKEGCCGSRNNLLLNTKTEIYHGINEDECKSIIKEFFKQKR
jgi:tRNA(adenine34) deaminase